MDQNELMRNIRATQSMVFGDDGESNIYCFTRSANFLCIAKIYH